MRPTRQGFVAWVDGKNLTPHGSGWQNQILHEPGDWWAAGWLNEELAFAKKVFSFELVSNPEALENFVDPIEFGRFSELREGFFGRSGIFSREQIRSLDVQQAFPSGLRTRPVFVANLDVDLDQNIRQSFAKLEVRKQTFLTMARTDEAFERKNFLPFFGGPELLLQELVAFASKQKSFDLGAELSDFVRDYHAAKGDSFWALKEAANTANRILETLGGFIESRADVSDAAKSQSEMKSERSETSNKFLRDMWDQLDENQGMSDEFIEQLNFDAENRCANCGQVGGHRCHSTDGKANI